ncbi:hypothetical protein BJ165DRAFT_1527919 [Panaeolus papilionaceus]|nr:hypothetical protein BJ165DRAFT_1527919 [Panaeolus papilionaceus]
MSNERPNSGCFVVAPRPVRLSRNTEFNITSSQNLPTEALEEFLSILKPTFLTMPRSYNFSGGFDRVSPLKHLTASGRFSPVGGPIPSGVIANGGGAGGAEYPPAQEGRRSTGASPSPSQLSVDRSTSSPVSRMQTRNPFARNIDTRSPVQIPTKIPSSPHPSVTAVPIAVPPSPAAIPLPVPSPDEMRVLEAL